MPALRLRKNELCPLHRSRFCCGRGTRIESKRKSRDWELIAPGVRRYKDGREACTDAELRRRKHHLLKTAPVCYGCKERFLDYRDAELAHIVSKGMNSWKRDDSMSNLVLLCVVTNRDCGSRNLDEYIAEHRAANKPLPCEVKVR